MASVKEAWIKKYGEDTGLQMWEDRKRKSANTLENYILKYGCDIGKLKYDELQEKFKFRFTLPWFIERYGETQGPIKYKERNSKMSVGIQSLKERGFTDDEILDIRGRHSMGSAITLANQIKKYGEEEGRRRYAITRERIKLGSVRRLDYWIKKNDGNIEQAKIDLSNSQKRNLDFFINKYGDVIGLEKYNVARINWKLGQRGIFNSRGQLEVENWLCTIFTDVAGIRKDTGIILTESEKSGIVKNNVIYPDIIVNNKYIINYNGDFWHANPAMFPDDDMINKRTKKTAGYIRAYDAARNEICKNRGYVVIDIWESEWIACSSDIKNKLLNIIK